MAVDANIAIAWYEKIQDYISDKGVLEVVVRDKKKKFRSLPKLFLDEIKDTDKKDNLESAIKALSQRIDMASSTGKAALSVANKLSAASVILNTINLGATCAGFIVMSAKLDKMNSKINQKLDSLKKGQELQVYFQFNKVISKHMNMLDSKRRNRDFSLNDMLELVNDENNLLKLFIGEIGNSPVGDLDEFIYSIFSLAGMLAASIKYYDEMDFFKDNSGGTTENPWHVLHDSWMQTFDMLLTPEFTNFLQDHGFFDLNMSSTEVDAYYISLSKQVVDLKRDISDTQFLLKKIGDKEKYEDFLSYINQVARAEFEKEMSLSGIDFNDEEITNSLNEAYKQVALA